MRLVVVVRVALDAGGAEPRVVRRDDGEAARGPREREVVEVGGIHRGRAARGESLRRMTDGDDGQGQRPRRRRKIDSRGGEALDAVVPVRTVGDAVERRPRRGHDSGDALGRELRRDVAHGECRVHRAGDHGSALIHRHRRQARGGAVDALRRVVAGDGRMVGAWRTAVRRCVRRPSGLRVAAGALRAFLRGRGGPGIVARRRSRRRIRGVAARCGRRRCGRRRPAGQERHDARDRPEDNADPQHGGHLDPSICDCHAN